MTAASPDYAGPLTGWRVWLVTRKTDEPHRLASVVTQCVWPAGGKLIAHCMPCSVVSDSHPAPERACRCGIYAARGVEALRGYLGHPHGCGMYPRAIGLVALWGNVIEHEFGWRAQFAYPLKLWLPGLDPLERPLPGWSAMALDLADYGVPIEPIDAGGEAALLPLLRALERRTERELGLPT